MYKLKPANHKKERKIKQILYNIHCVRKNEHFLPGLFGREIGKMDKMKEVVVILKKGGKELDCF